jgi:hypothetical protein
VCQQQQQQQQQKKKKLAAVSFIVVAGWEILTCRTRLQLGRAA